ncbi:MAG: LysR substrate-binding domain-containing protein [Pseudomonadota bacterium]
MDRVETMRAFLAVADTGSFTRAGGKLGVSTKLVSKYVAALETRLGTQLFMRTTRSVRLTDAGMAFLERCRPLIDGFDELEDDVRERQTELSGTLRVTAPTGFGSMRLAAALARFASTHPGVKIDLRLTNERLALVEEGIDLAVRIGTLEDSALVARRLAPMPVYMVASPDYLAAHGRPADPAALADHACLTIGRGGEPITWRFQRGDEEMAVRLDPRFATDAPVALAAAAAAGLGIARVVGYAAEEGLASGGLERLLPDWDAGDMGLYALYPPNRHLTRRLRALIDHLAAEFGTIAR